MTKRTILLYGRTNAGKTAQIGQLAEHVFLTTGLKTRLYTADRGGTATVQPYIDLGIIEVVELADTDPWVFLHKAVRGYIRDAQGKFVLDAARNAKIGLYAFESLRSFAETLLMSMAVKAGQGVNIGGGSNTSFKVISEGETLQVSGGNQTHYKVAQDRMTEELWESQRLNAPYILWTSSVSKDEDTASAGKVLGPDVIGKALTVETPRWFNLTFRIDVLPAKDNVPERHILYLGNHVDVQAGNAGALGNTRKPLDAPELPKLKIEPASIVEALKILDGGAKQATDVIKKRLGAALNKL